MRYLGIVTALFLSLLAGYLYLDNRRLDARVVAEVASHQQTKSDYRAAQAEAHALDVQRLLAEEPKTLQEVADQYGLTRERARQIEAKVIAKLREFLGSAIN
jgi:RNA polymerase sigma-32 factor